MKILCIKDHVCSRINNFCERIGAITNPSFTVGRLNRREEDERLATTLEEGMKILCIKDHVCSRINNFCERIGAITNPSFTVGRLNRREEDERLAFLQFPENHCSCILYVL